MEGTITPTLRVSGSLSGASRVSGTLSGGGTLTGALSVPETVSGAYYDGDYEVTPRAHEAVTLATEGKTMRDDVTVFQVPYYVTSNVSGQTAYIASEV